ncbi:MAG: hypothetical protein IJ157_07765 [Clostridia bacterium]|nr:hypothetical protein [Clostridia bacterium]
MKKFIAVLLIAVSLLALCVPAVADAPLYYDFGSVTPVAGVQGPLPDGSWTGEVIARQITLFSQAKSSSTSLRKLPNGTQFTILDVKDSYAHVMVDNGNGGFDTGYVMFDYVIENPTHIVLRSNSGVYALAGPYAVNKRVGTLENYQRFTVIAETGNYYIVSFRDAVAFLPMSADYWVEEDLAEMLAKPGTPGYVINDKTKVYGYASTQYGKIDTFNSGTPVEIYYTTNGFAAVRYNNVLAFIQTSDLVY